VRGSVRFFASLREAAGRSDMAWELADGATLADLLAHLRRALPALEQPIDSAWLAVNRRYAALDAGLQEGDEVALFPPVSGG